MNEKFGFLEIIAAATLCFLCAAAQAQETNLRAAVFVPLNTTYGEFFTRFAEETNRRGKGLVQIRSLGPDAVPAFELANAVRTGVIDIAVLPPAFYSSLMPEADAQSLSSQNLREQRKSGAWAAINELTKQKVNAWYLASYGSGVQFHIYTNKPVMDGDFRTFRLRTAPNYTPFFQSLGASLVNTAPGEVQMALERHAIDGYGWPIIGIFDLGWGNHTKFRIDPGFYNVRVNVMVNLPKWNSLREEQRALLTQMADWADAENTKWAAEKVSSESQQQANAGIKVIDLGPDHRKRAHEVYWAELSRRSPQAISVLRPLLER